MIQSASVRILVDNNPGQSGLTGEHGLALLLTVTDGELTHRICLDAGATEHTLAVNLSQINPPLDQVRAVVLSHGHYDHTTGLLPLLAAINTPVPLVFHPLAWEPKFIISPFLRPIGARVSLDACVAAGAIPVAVTGPAPLADHIMTTGQIPRNEPTETVKGFHRLEAGLMIEDVLPDDQSVVIDLGEPGLAIITGCCHSGLINTVTHAQRITGREKVRAIMGGLHLVGAEESRLSRTISFLRELAPNLLVPLHCTGREETQKLKQALPEMVRLAGTFAGDEIKIL